MTLGRPAVGSAGLIALALATGACAPTVTEGRVPAADVGRILVYTRANWDGSEAETIRVYRASETRLEVVKTREACTSAAFVSARLDPAHGDATELAGGRLQPGAAHSEEAWLTLTPDGRRLELRVGDRAAAPSESIAIGQRPWHLYDYDLATLSAMPPAGAVDGGDFSFGLALSLVRDDGLDLRWLGGVTARFAGRERLRGATTNRFTVEGPGLPGGAGGSLWTDARDGHVVAARWGLPNHVEYSSFSLTLVDRARGAAAWRRMLLAHYAGCKA